MENPFRKRASENVDKSDAFLQLVSPEPIDLILDDRVDELYDRLVYVIGTPGSGKTTLGRLFEFKNLQFLAEQHQHAIFRNMAKTLSAAGALDESSPKIIAARLTMDAEYRSIYELPYPREVKNGLLKGLIQARCVLLWLRELAALNIPDSQIRTVLGDDSPAAEKSIGAEDIHSLRETAIAVEESIYDVIHALIPKDILSFPSQVTEPYELLKYITGLKVMSGNEKGSSVKILKSMVIIDDAHELHPFQFMDISRWLLERRFGSARWIMGRLDTLSPSSALGQLRPYATDYDLPGYKKDRDYIILSTDQTVTSKRNSRKNFQNIARDISKRYLEQMPLFRSRHQTDISALLKENPPELTSSAFANLEEKIARTAESLRITPERIEQLKILISDYSSAKAESADVRLMMLRVLMHRHSKRTPQQSLFEEAIDIAPSKPLSADISVLDAARLHLFHEYDRPYYYGFESIAIASGNNVEQYLQIAGALVDQIELRMIRKRNASLDQSAQHKIVREVATSAIKDWDFPLRDSVLKLVDHIGNEALKVSLAPNSPLGAGANSYGILQSEFLVFETKYPQLGQVLHYAVAYNAIKVVKDYNCKNELWTLFVLGSYPIIKYGLTFKLGGFVEGSASRLNKVIGGEA